jgi:hypothetical protein
MGGAAAVVLLAALPGLARADAIVRDATGRCAFTVSAAHGNIVAAARAGRPALASCLDEYWLQVPDGSFPARSTEAADRVLSAARDAGGLRLTCRNEGLGLTVTKLYAAGPAPGSLRKTVTVGPVPGGRALHVFSRVRLARAFAEGAYLYTPRQSWVGRTLLYGVRPLAEVKAPVTSSSGWDNRFVAAFRADRALAVSHWRAEVDGLWVPATGGIVEWGKESPCALTYLPDGWRWRLLMAARSKTSAAADYVLHPGDWYDAWRLYLALPELRRAYSHLDRVPDWCRRVKYGTFWNPPFYEDAAKGVKALCERLGPDACMTIGVFGWCLDGDFGTEKPFMTEGLSLAMTPDYMARAVAALQEDRRARVGPYIQGGLLDSESQAYRDHPDWVVRDAAGRPVDSGFADNPVGHMYSANPRVEAWVAHQLARVRAVCRRYRCGYIYLDGGGFAEGMDWARGDVSTFADCGRLNERFFGAVRATAADRGLLINSQNAPYADMSWLECGYFEPSVPWPDTVDFCFDTEAQSDPRYTLEPLYWRDNDRYLAMCIAFGFTPCGGASAEMPEATWHAIEAAWRMKPGRLVLDSSATAPLWWREGVPVVTFAERVGADLIVPVLNFGEGEAVTVTVSPKAAGLTVARYGAEVTRPLVSATVEHPLSRTLGDGRLAFDLSVPTSWRGITLLWLRRSEAGSPQGR